MANNLIIYYSRRGENYSSDGSFVNLEKGNTEYVAEYIRDAVGGDLFRVETIEEYPADYLTCTEVAKKEQKANARPALKEYLDSAEGYDNIFVCGPCWWGTFPMAVLSQLDRLDLAGKTLFPVMTHEGSGLGTAAKTLKKTCRKATVGKGLAVRGSDAKDSRELVTDWARCSVAWHE